jgi:DNA-binding NarL/FixJ family response regulator
MDATPIRVLVVDDHTLLREGTRHLLAGVPDLVVVGEVSRGDEVVDAVHEYSPDVVLLDIQLPGLNGIDVTRAVRAVTPAVKILILTAHADEDYVHAALGAGASGYLLKTTSGNDLAEAIRTVHAGTNTVLDTSLAQVFISHLQMHSMPASSHLTPREHEIMELVARGLSNRAIAYKLGISPRTVEGHLRRTFEKENVNSRVELVRHALEHRLLSIPPV